MAREKQTRHSRLQFTAADQEPVGRTFRVLSVSDDAVLRTVRARILRSRFFVVACDSATAPETFLSGDFDVVVFCSTVPYDRVLVMTKLVAAAGRATVIARVHDYDRTLPHVITLPRFDVSGMNDTLEQAARHATTKGSKQSISF